MAQLALGTVQFGLDYGIANRTGQVGLDAVRAILSEASKQGVEVLDTAFAYGESETVLGHVGVEGWRVVTKLPGIPCDVVDAEAWVRNTIRSSLRRLNTTRLDAVLLHRPEDLLGAHGEGLQRGMAAAKEAGWTGNVGISIYQPDELDSVLAVFTPDLVQAPLNVLDRRLVSSQWARRLKSLGVEIHCRSVFLQGLLLMAPADRPAKFSRWQPVWSAWDSWLAASRVSALEACLGYAMGQAEVDQVVVGVDSLAHLREIVAAAHASPPAVPDWSDMTSPDLLDPSHWNSL